MKKTIQIFALGAALFVAACKGDKGDVGPAGLQGTVGKEGAVGVIGVAGTAGAAGTTGPKGDQGAAKVVYTAWVGFPTNRIGRGTGFLQFGNTSTTEAAFTKEAIDQGVIITYIKFNNLILNTATQAYELVETVTANTSPVSYFKIPGRVQNRFEDFGVATIFTTLNRRENFYDPLLNVWSRTFASTGAPVVPELQNLSDDQYRAFVKDMPQYRHVVIYGSTKGRMASIDINDYAAVKAASNIAD